MKSRFIAAFFAFFLGGIGINNFYTKHTALGVLDIVFCWTFIPKIVNIVRGCEYLWCNDDLDFNSRHVEGYNKPKEILTD